MNLSFKHATIPQLKEYFRIILISLRFVFAASQLAKLEGQRSVCKDGCEQAAKMDADLSVDISLEF
jgi:hypothetical protein